MEHTNAFEGAQNFKAHRTPADTGAGAPMPMHFLAPGTRSRCLVALLLPTLLCAAIAACTDRQVPAELVGRWVSEDPRYAGRSLEIRWQLVKLGIDANTSQVFVIRDVESEASAEGPTRYVLHYDDEEGTDQALRLELVPGPPPGLRLENHSELWVREDADPGRESG